MIQYQLKTTLAAFYKWESRKGDQPFLRQPSGHSWIEYSWAEVGQQARKMAAHLRQYPEGSQIAILSHNCAHWFIADLAIMMAGHVSVPVYPTANVETIRTILEHSETRLVFIGKLPDWPSRQAAIPEGTDLVSFFQRQDGVEHWDDIIEELEPIEDAPVRKLDEMASIIYTSGTTGIPKGAMHDFRAFANAAAAAMDYIDLEQESFFSYLPLAHCAERALVEHISIHSGSVVSFTESLETFQQNITSVRPTIFFGVPRIWLKFQQGVEEKIGRRKLKMLLAIPGINRVIAKKIRAGLGLDRVKIPLSGAAALPRDVIDWFDRIGIPICEAYGLTETLAFSHANIPQKRRVGSVGVTLPTAEARISDGGEILLRSPCLMMGYYKEPLKTEQAMDRGFFKTGDLGRLQPHGYLRITGRVKDLFKTSKGKYVSPIPIEAKLEPELGAEHLCVVGDGMPSPVAIASMPGGSRPDQAGFEREAENLLNRLNNQLEKHERLARIIIVDEAWTTDNGLITPTLKIRRPMIEEKYADLIAESEASDKKVIWASR